MKLNKISTEQEFKKLADEAIFNDLEMGRFWAIVRNARAKGFDLMKYYSWMGLNG